MTEVVGQTGPSTNASEYNMLAFVVSQLLNKLQTVTLVEVVAVSNDGGVSPVGTVDVRPLVNQMSGDRIATPHGVIYGIPYFRLQGGTDAVILDPKVGDLGMCAFASRDISAVKAAKGAANPGSFRKFDWADGLYFGGLLNGVPAQYLRFHSGGITVVSPTKITLSAPNIEILGNVLMGVAGDVEVNGSVTVVGGDVEADGVSLKTHVHSGVTAGGANTGPPVP